jgi:DNA-binding NarL/FixJ family response regulator
MIKIVLISENVLARSGVAAMLARQPDLEVLGEARSQAEVTRLCEQTRPDLFILDAPILKKETADIVRQLSALDRGSAPPVLVLTSRGDGHEFDLLRVGSCALISRISGPAELTSCIRLLAVGYVVVERRLATRLASGVRRFSDADDVEAHRVIELTSREREVFALMTQGHSNVEIARALAVASSTVKSHVKEIYKKLGLKNRVEAALYGTIAGFKDKTGDQP